jgi:hypothetical protein
MRARYFTTFFLLAGLVAALPLRAEVSAKLDAHGHYSCMIFRYTPGSGGGRVWSVSSPATNRRPLNPFGDIRGDLAPTVLENGAQSNYPIAVWAHPSGGDYDLVYSQWLGTAWSGIRHVHAHTAGNEFEPMMTFNSGGQVFLVWWRNDQGQGSVYFSMLNGIQWTDPLRISPMRVDARHPTVTALTDTVIRVTYETSAGTVSRDVILSRSESITDDIDPKYQIDLSADR